MKRMIFAVLLLAGTMGVAQAQDFSVTVVVKGATTKDGTVKYGLFSSKENFLKNPHRYDEAIVSEDGTATLSFDGLKPGEYAISVYHDENGNGELDDNFFKMPTEPYGFSNDARGKFGPASFEDAKVRVVDHTTVVIHLN